MIHKWLGITGLLLMTTSTVLAQSGSPIIYTDIEWQIIEKIDYTGDMRSPMLFLNVAADEEGHLYVANFGSVLVYDAETGVLEGAIQDNSGTLLQYDDVAPAGDGDVWVADSKSLSVYLLDLEGSVLQAIPFNPPLDKPNLEMHPNELEVGPDGNLYVMYSSTDSTLEVFTPDGEFVRSFTMGDRKLSTGLNDFAFGPDGNLYVAGVGTVRVFDVEGNIVVEYFAQDFLEASLMSIRGIAVDAEGNVYIGGNSTAEDNSIVAAVYKFDADGQLLGQFGKGQQRINWGEEFGPGELGFTVSLVVLPEGHLVISDTNTTYDQLLRVNTTE